MKKYIIIILLAPLLVKAEHIATSKITDVTVYQQGARITREATINLNSGNNEIVISELTTSLDANSVQVRLSGNAVLLSATSRTRLLQDNELPQRTKVLQDSIKMLRDELQWLDNKKNVYTEEGKLIQANQKLGTNEEKATVDEIIKLANFYRERLLEIRNNTHKLGLKITGLNKEIKKLEQKLNNLRHSEKRNVGEVVINISSKEPARIKAVISYLSYQAGWKPIYDVRVKNANAPVKLIYKANVSQTTGYKWESANLTISTGNPTLSNDRPIMKPWHINFIQPIVYYQQNQGLKKKSSLAVSQNMYQRSMAVSNDEVQKEELFESIDYEVHQTESSIAAEYAIEIKQDIPSDGKQHLVAIKEYELNSKFTYHAVPKLNKAAFLLAKVADYGSYNLLPGQSNLFFNGMYIGQSYLNPITTVDSMLLSLGRDEKIVIKRNQLKDLTAKQVIGGNVKETKAIEISVRNNNSYSLELDLMDQLPISDNKDIEVKVEEIEGAEYDETYGTLLWKLNLKPNDNKRVRFVYTVKYPKGKTVNNQ